MSLVLLSCVLLLSQKLSLLELRQAVQSLRSSEARLSSQKALLDAKMAAAAASPPPPPPPPALPYEDDARSVGSTVRMSDMTLKGLTRLRPNTQSEYVCVCMVLGQVQREKLPVRHAASLPGRNDPISQSHARIFHLGENKCHVQHSTVFV